MGAFTITTMFAFPIGLGTLVMSGTNPEVDEAKIAKLRQDAGLDTKIMQDVNKRRLGVLLDEIQRGDKGEERWKAALDGRTAGTTSGSSKGVKM